MVTIQVCEDQADSPPSTWWRAVWQPTSLAGPWMRSEINACRELFRILREEKPAELRRLITREVFLVDPNLPEPRGGREPGNPGGAWHPPAKSKEPARRGEK